MKLEELDIPKKIFDVLKQQNIETLTPAQNKAVKADLLKRKNLLVCTPTASGKTLIAELAFTKSILETGGKAIYIVPLKALASEKYKEFKKRYSKLFKVALSIGDLDRSDPYLGRNDLIVTVSEKLDSLVRHDANWLKNINTVIIDEVHLLNDPGRGPTLEILITILRMLLNDVQIIALSATIGNPKELAEWLEANLVLDKWRPVKLEKSVYLKGEIKTQENP